MHMLNAAEYAAIHILFDRGHSRREISRLVGRNRATIKKVLRLKVPPARKPRTRTVRLDSFRDHLARLLKDGTRTGMQILQSLRELGFTGSWRSAQSFVGKRHKQQQLNRTRAVLVPCGTSLMTQHHFWMLRLLQGDITAPDLHGEFAQRLSLEEAELLVEHVRVGRLSLRNRAITVAAHLKGISLRSTSWLLFLNRATLRHYLCRFREGGLSGLFGRRTRGVKKADDPVYQEGVFKLLHAPPKSFGVNRTAWTMLHLKRVLAKQGFRIAACNVRAIIRKAGYRFRKAKKVLTSNDPDYRTKLQEITSILRNLKPDEKFFSVDEFGPFAVKVQGGRSLVKEGQVKTVPQRQKSKGSLILTAALELSENQVTHFYSERKNTDEMLKLLEILLVKYAGASCIYFSWDAASWHASKKLYNRVEEINSSGHRATHNTPLVKLAPLPSCAQFLNVIESVFSGMARAIIHNSDYQSVNECKTAIDRHFLERNQHFKTNPQRAGKKIWDKELVPATFSETHNCKDPRW